MANQEQNNLAALIKENLKKTDLVMKKLEKLEKEFKRAQIMNLIRFLIVAIPVFFAILYLIPIFREILETVRPLIDYFNQFNPL